jgi:hypothetical protein
MLFDHLVAAGKVVLGEVVKLRWRGPNRDGRYLVRL